MCVYIHILVYIHIYVCVCVCVYIYIYIYIYIYTVSNVSVDNMTLCHGSHVDCELWVGLPSGADIRRLLLQCVFT